MNLGTVLVLVGTILAGIDLLIALPARSGVVWATGKLVAVGVILIGIGVLCGPEKLIN